MGQIRHFCYGVQLASISIIFNGAEILLAPYPLNCTASGRGCF